MAIAEYIIAPSESTIQVGGTVPFLRTGSGVMATINGNAPTWTNLVGCAIQGDGSVKDTASGSGWGLSGAVSAETITVGDGFVEFIANTEAAIPGVYDEFGGRQFFAGLTRQSTVNSFVEIDFALQVFQGGVVVYESGVLQAVIGAARNGGVYRVAIVNGLVEYYADNRIIYRSGSPITYPLRFGAVFLNRGFDHIGGTPALPGTLSAPAGTFFAGAWTAPNVRGRYRITTATSNNLFAFAFVNVQAIFPKWQDGLIVQPRRFTPLPAESKFLEQEFDDLGAEYNEPYPDKEILRWRLEFDGLKESECSILDEFYRTHKRANAFYFHDWRADNYAGELYNNVRFSNYTRSHNSVKWQQRTVELIRRPT